MSSDFLDIERFIMKKEKLEKHSQGKIINILKYNYI